MTEYRLTISLADEGNFLHCFICGNKLYVDKTDKIYNSYSNELDIEKELRCSYSYYHILITIGNYGESPQFD